MENNQNTPIRFAFPAVHGYFMCVMGWKGSDILDFSLEARRFFGIQMRRYLNSRPQRHFSGSAERDAVFDMIRDAWIELRCCGCLEGLSPKGRETVYRTTIIIFPDFIADAGDKCLAVDFKKKTRIGPSRYTMGG